MASVGIAAQVAEAGRLIAAAPLIPIISRLGDAVGAADRDRLHREFSRLDRLWSDAIVGGVVVGAACAYPLLTAWLGNGYGEASAFAAMLIVAYGVNVMAGVRLAYLRAVGRIGLEARSGLLLIALNVAFTIPLAIAFGAPGVVAGHAGRLSPGHRVGLRAVRRGGAGGRAAPRGRFAASGGLRRCRRPREPRPCRSASSRSSRAV